MAEASNFEESNLVLNPPPGMSLEECSVLNVLKIQFDDGTPVVYSCWKLTKEELEEVNKTGRIWLTIYGTSMPPACIAGIKPFTVVDG